MQDSKLTLKHKTYLILEHVSHGFWSHLIHYSLMFLILLTVVSVILESDPGIYNQYQVFFYNLEWFTLIVFSIEYVVRLWCCTESPAYSGWKGRVKYIFSPMALIDLLAILPVWFGLIIYKDLMILRSVRLIRVLKLTRYSRSINLLLTVLKQESLNILSALFVLCILIIIAATGIHTLESETQQQFSTIPKTIWWATATLTTVGYGDIVPLTTMGRALAVFIMISGVAIAALPAGILAAGFSKELGQRKEKFKNRVVYYFADGELSVQQKFRLKELASELGISQPAAQSIIWNIRQQQTYISDVTCPHCEQTFELEHLSGNVQVKK